MVAAAAAAAAVSRRKATASTLLMKPGRRATGASFFWGAGAAAATSPSAAASLRPFFFLWRGVPRLAMSYVAPRAAAVRGPLLSVAVGTQQRGGKFVCGAERFRRRNTRRFAASRSSRWSCPRGPTLFLRELACKTTSNFQRLSFWANMAAQTAVGLA